MLISISFWTLSSVTFTISLLTIPNNSVLISISWNSKSNRWECTERNRYQYRSVMNS
jgi:hypothetical protein